MRMWVPNCFLSALQKGIERVESGAKKWFDGTQFVEYLLTAWRVTSLASEDLIFLWPELVSEVRQNIVWSEQHLRLSLRAHFGCWDSDGPHQMQSVSDLVSGGQRIGVSLSLRISRRKLSGSILLTLNRNTTSLRGLEIVYGMTTPLGNSVR